NRKVMVALLVIGAVLLVAAGAVYFVSSRDSSTPSPPLEVTPPGSLTELAEQYPQLAPVLTDPELDSVYKEFLLAYQQGGEEAALELAGRRGMLTPAGDVAIALILDTEENVLLVAQLEAVGVTVVSTYRDRVNVAVPIGLVEAELQTEEPGAIFNQLTELEHVIGVQLPERRIHDGSTIEGEGVAVIGADDWHQAGFTGAGLRVGVLDLGFANYDTLLAVELPDDVPIATFGWYDDEEVHGTACAEIIHEVAPGAELFFAWYDGSDAAMGEAVDWLVEQGVDIISHSASGLVGPRDGSEWDAQLVDDLAARGILWVNSSGNEALSHYRGNFTDEDGDDFHEFAPGEEMLALFNDGYVQIALNWEDDWEHATQDYELFLYDAVGSELASSQDPQTGEFGHEPVEWIEYETGGETVYAAIVAYDVDRAVTLDVFVNGADVAYPSPDHSICPPADAVGSLTVGAANWLNDSLAEYSSQGPTTDGRLKPEISAPTGVSGATYGTEDFYGTSASCPHVAGAAALVWQANPEFTRQEVVDFLLAHAVDAGPSGPDTGHGYGRLQLSSPPAGSPVSRPTPTLAQQPAPGTTATPVPLPTPTPVTYSTPEPVLVSGPGTGLLMLTGLGLLAGGLGCAGMGLLLVGLLGLLIIRRRTRRAPSAPQPLPRPRPSVPLPPAPPPVSHAPPADPTPPPPQLTRCQSCGAATRPGTRFCPACGRPIAPASRPLYCRHCGAHLREEARFCPRCGESV
ncbi:MAG: S8 family serine peptidase, partial [Chloroflexota bacterium]|nr:S8 family serine peptidase [Chloroflexota bacterium]